MNQPWRTALVTITAYAITGQNYCRRLLLSSGAIVCRNCHRNLSLSGAFWADDRGQIYCETARGQHVPAVKEPESP